MCLKSGTSRGFTAVAKAACAKPHNGVHCKNAFVTTALCSPSRASILTGLYAHRYGVVDNNNPIPPGTIFFPEYLQKSGYRTAMIGKWQDKRYFLYHSPKAVRADFISAAGELGRYAGKTFTPPQTMNAATDAEGQTLWGKPDESTTLANTQCLYMPPYADRGGQSNRRRESGSKGAEFIPYLLRSPKAATAPPGIPGATR